MLCVVEPGARGRRDRGLRAMGDARHADRHGQRQRTPAGARPATRWPPTCRSRSWSTTARCTTSSRRRPRSPCTRAPAAALTGDESRGADAARAARVAPTSRPGALCSSSTTRSCSRAPCAGPSRPTRPSSRCPTAARSRSRSTATDGASPAIRVPARSRPCSSARRTSPASARPRSGLTNCLNFGNPEKPHVAWQMVEAVDGIAEACEALGVPVVGGNVSLYNEAPAGPIFPTPVIGMVGRLPDAARAGRLGFAQAGDADRARRTVRAVAGRLRARQAVGPRARRGASAHGHASCP